MKSDYYSEGDQAPDAAPAEAGQDQSQDDDSKSFLAPKDAFGGDCKVGDTYTVKVTGIYGDELELAPADDKSATEAAPDKSSDADMEAQLSSMSQQ